MTDSAEPPEAPPQRRHVTTAFVQRPDGAVLLVKRSGRVGTYQHQWGAISGGLEQGDESAAFRAQQEVRRRRKRGRHQAARLRLEPGEAGRLDPLRSARVQSASGALWWSRVDRLARRPS